MPRPVTPRPWEEYHTVLSRLFRQMQIDEDVPESICLKVADVLADVSKQMVSNGNGKKAK